MAQTPTPAGDGNLQSVKGMRDIIGGDFYKFQGFFEKAQEVAMYYGFEPITTPILEDAGVFNRSIGEGTDIIGKEMYTLKTKGGDHLALRPEGTAPVVRAYLEHGMKSLPQPVMLYYSGPFFRHDKPQRGRYRQFHQFGIEVLGLQKSITDALVIQTLMKILEEAGATELVVDINSIGDKESRAAYIKALTAYYKKFLNDLPAIDRERLKTNPLRILDSKEKKTIEINEQAPDAMSYLNGPSKKHFKEVLEYLEEAGIPYRINKAIVRGLDYYTHTVFEIIDTSEGETQGLAFGGGGRYDGLARQLGSKKDVPGVGAGIGVDRVIEAPWYKGLEPRIIKEPKCYFIQLGFDAKLKSLAVLEVLRKAKIPAIQAIAKDRLSVQLAQAEKIGVPYVLILGQREAIDGTVIVRDMTTRSQESVKIDELGAHLKKLK